MTAQLKVGEKKKKKFKQKTIFFTFCFWRIWLQQQRHKRRKIFLWERYFLIELYFTSSTSLTPQQQTQNCKAQNRSDRQNDTHAGEGLRQTQKDSRIGTQRRIDADRKDRSRGSIDVERESEKILTKQFNFFWLCAPTTSTTPTTRRQKASSWFRSSVFAPFRSSLEYHFLQNRKKVFSQ